MWFPERIGALFVNISLKDLISIQRARKPGHLVSDYLEVKLERGQWRLRPSHSAILTMSTQKVSPIEFTWG